MIGWLVMIKPDTAQLTEPELQRVLISFNGEQQPRVITGIHSNPGILTHEVCGRFYCNNVPDVAQKSNERLLNHGLKLVCYPQDKPNKLTKSHHWYLVRVGEVEFLPTNKKAANDEGTQ